MRYAIATLLHAGCLARRGLIALACLLFASTAADAAILASEAEAAGAGPSPDPSYPEVMRPPAPLAKLRVYEVRPSGRQVVTGGHDEDLLLVHPPQTIVERFQLEVDGFRGIYYIGGSFDPAPGGWLRTPSGRTAQGIAALLRLRTHRAPVARPFVYLARLRFQASRIAFGDWIQVGGGAPVGAWQHWPDLYRHKILADPLFGWDSYHGGSFGPNVSHSDVTKYDMGGIRHSYTAAVDLGAGYHGDYATPSWATGFTAYAGPDGHGRQHYWSTVLRLVVDRSLGSEPTPVALFLARGPEAIRNGEYYTTILHEGGTDGRGVFVVPPSPTAPLVRTVFPSSGSFAPIEANGALVWPASGLPDDRPFVVGRAIDGRRTAPPGVARPDQVGWARRVTNRQALLREIEGGFRD